MSKMPSINSVAKQIARRIAVGDGDMILVKKSSDYDEIRMFEAIRRSLGLLGKEKCVVVVVNEFDEIAVWDEIKLKEYGWCKCEPDISESEI